MCSAKINAINGFEPQARKNQKPITRGLDYTAETLKEAVVSNPNEAYVVKHIPRTIKNVDEFIRSSGLEVTPEDREDMIQEAILASLEKSKKPNYSQLANRIAAHNLAEKTSLKRVQKKIEEQNLIADLPQKPSTYTIGDSIAEVRGTQPVKKVMDEFLSRLPLIDEHIIRSRYCFNGDEPCTYKQLSLQLGVHPNTISSMEDRALMRLRHPSRRRIIRDYLFETPNGNLYSIEGPEDRTYWWP